MLKKAKNSVEFLKRKMIYAKMFVIEYIEQIKIKMNFLK